MGNDVSSVLRNSENARAVVFTFLHTTNPRQPGYSPTSACPTWTESRPLVTYSCSKQCSYATFAHTDWWSSFCQPRAATQPSISPTTACGRNCRFNVCGNGQRRRAEFRTRSGYAAQESRKAGCSCWQQHPASARAYALPQDAHQAGRSPKFDSPWPRYPGVLVCREDRETPLT